MSFSIAELIGLGATGTICIEITIVFVDGVYAFGAPHHHICSV
jgi:hypothetical protein